MKQDIKSPIIGFLSLLFIDSLSRVIFTVYMGLDFSPFSYVVYPEFYPWVMIGISFIAAFIGAMMVITFSGRRWFPFILYLIALGLWRLAPLILVPSEPDWIIYLSGGLSLAGAFGSRQFIVDRKSQEEN